MLSCENNIMFDEMSNEGGAPARAATFWSSAGVNAAPGVSAGVVEGRPGVVEVKV